MIDFKPTILLVEDNEEDAFLLRRALRLEKVDCTLHVAEDGQEAIEYLGASGKYTNREQYPFPNLVLLDLKLPKLSGLEVLERLRADERTKTLPVVILTSSDEERDILGSYDLGANSYVRKPVDFTEFIDAVRQLGIYWLSMNRVPGDSIR